MKRNLIELSIVLSILISGVILSACSTYSDNQYWANVSAGLQKVEQTDKNK